MVEAAFKWVAIMKYIIPILYYIIILNYTVAVNVATINPEPPYSLFCHPCYLYIATLLDYRFQAVVYPSFGLIDCNDSLTICS